MSSRPRRAGSLKTGQDADVRKHAPRDLDRARLNEYQIDLEWTRAPAAIADGRVSL